MNADAAYRRASEYGHAPEPGLALLRLAQGEPRAAEAAIRRVLGEPYARRRRAAILAAGIEIMLEVGDLPAARAAADELAISDRTVDRHVSNILSKLALPSRSAATAYAYERGLVQQRT